MKIIKPSFKILDTWSGNDILKKIERAGRLCYKSENYISDDSCKKFCKTIIKSGHHSVLEHYSISVQIVCDRGVSHEIVRHRIASYSQECLTGDTFIRVGNGVKTIKELYDRKNGMCYDKTHNKTINIRSVNEKGEIILNKLVDVFYKGKQPIYEVITKLGYKIKTTLKHKFLNKDKIYSELENFVVGDTVYVNGRPCLIEITDYEIKRLYEEVGLSPKEISLELDVPYRSVIGKLKRMEIFVSHKNDKNKEKYNFNHTKKSYEKMQQTISEQYKNGRRIWNKGLNESNEPGIKKQADALRNNHHKNGFEEKNSNWKGDRIESLSGKRLRFSKYKKEKCELCGSKLRLENHHIDKDPNNYNKNNKQTLCIDCHNLIHHGWNVGKKIIEDEIISICEIGQEDVYDIEMKKPYNNFIANGFIVHNSTRYCNYSKNKFGNEITVILPCFWDKEVPNRNYYTWKTACEHAEKMYFELIKDGATAQEARSVLPNSLKTEIVCTFNIREWRHFFKLRCSKKAHPQMREIAIPILEEFKKYISVLFDDITY